MPKVGMQRIRRKQILDAAFESVAKHSLESTRMRQIAKVAGVSQPSIHYYFDTKDKLIIALLDRLLNEFKEGREERLAMAEEPLAKLRVLLEEQKRIISEKSYNLEVYYDFWVQATKRELVREKIQNMYASWYADLRKVLEEGVEKGIFDQDRAQMGPSMLISLFQGAALQFLVDLEGFDLDSYFEEAGRMVLSYLRGEQG